MKKILLMLMSALAVFIIAGCAEEKSPAPAAELSYEEKVASTNVNDITAEEAIYMTVQGLYNVPELSENVKKHLITMYDVLQTGNLPLPDGTTIPMEGTGEVKHPAIASALFQSLYKAVVASNSANLQGLLTYSTMDNETLFYQAISNMAASPEDIAVIGSFITNFKTYIIPTQDNIVNVAKKYNAILLDSTSFASTTAGGGATVATKEYLISANIIYMFTDILTKAKVFLDFDAEIYPEKIDFMSTTLYDLADATKLKVTYNKSLVYFETTDAIDLFVGETMYNLVNVILTDINTTKQIPGGAPYPVTYVVKAEDGVIPQVTQDTTAADNPFYYKELGAGYVTADYLIYHKIGNYLLASPTGNNIYAGSDYGQLTPTNMVTNNMLYIYQMLKANGLKAPLYTGEIGADILAEIIGKYLRDNGIVYLNSNIPQDMTNINYQTFQYMVTSLFTPNATTGIAPACALIEEYNKTIDDSAVGNAYNTGYYTRDASGGLCGIYIDDTERKDFNAADYGD